jgi:triacylglycerol lipase
VVVYIHGGGWVRGDKVVPNPPGLFHHNIATYFVRNGMIGVNATYRLVPNVQWPGGGEDVASMAKWLKANIAQYGGDPEAIFMIGHSAGGTHLGTYLYHEGVRSADGAPIAGAILLSPAVGVPPPGGPREQVVRQYFGDDPAKWTERSPIGLVDAYKGRKVPTFIVTAEFDPAEIESPTAELYAKLCKKYEACPRYLQLRGHNHVSMAYSLNTDDEVFGQAVIDFVRATLAPQAATR